MKKIIFYSTMMGHCKDYADTIASRIECEFFDIKKMKYKLMEDKDIIIYIAPVNNNKIRKVDKFLKFYKKLKNKNLIIIAVGMQPKSKERRQDIITINILDAYHIRLYELTGGFDITKLSKFKQKLFRFSLKYAIDKDPTLQSNRAQAESILNYPLNFVDYDGIENIVSKIRNIERGM